jgi:UDP-N-acetylglucosamine 2-epimerase (non-hydrolysing)
LREGLPLDRIIYTGSPLYEVILKNQTKIDASTVLTDLNLSPKDYFVLSLHREENINLEDNFERVVKTIVEMVNIYDKDIIFSVHPRTRKKIEEKGVTLPSRVKLMAPLGLFDYMKLQKHALCVISDSGTISEESSILKFPAVNMRETHERHEAMDEGSVIMSGLNPERVIQAINILIENPDDVLGLTTPEAYTKDNVSTKVVRIIVSYVDYINRVVWSK